jgi:hypothetical protein
MATNQNGSRSTAPTTEEAVTPEVVTPKKRSPLQQVIEDKMLQELVSGSIWTLDETEIVARKATLDKFRKVISSAYRMYDEELKNQRKIHGNDHLKDVTYFRNPRTVKEGTSLMDDLSFGEDDES